jgi:multiple sugar transport system ATP-binding protein
MADVVYEGATRFYTGTERPAVNRLDLDIADGEFLVLVGPSGSGKSTALRMLAGLEAVDEGDIRIGGRAVSDLPPKERDIAMVFQNYALYPHMSVADNMAYALKIGKVPKEERDRRVKEAARMLDLEQYLERKPKALSGGQRQRVAMGRAIVREPQVFLMDEPLSNLDAKLRVQTRTEIAALQRRLGVTTVYVTHDQVEAMTMGDRVALLKDGILQQVDTPERLYEHPNNVFVAGFIGSPAMNLGEYALQDGHAVVGGTRLPLRREVLDAVSRDGNAGRITVGYRPEALEPVGAGQGFPVVVDLVESLGSDAFLHGHLQDGGNDGAGVITGQRIVARIGAREKPDKGDVVHLRIRPGEEHAFSSTTGERLGG